MIYVILRYDQFFQFSGLVGYKDKYTDALDWIYEMRGKSCSHYVTERIEISSSKAKGEQ